MGWSKRLLACLRAGGRLAALKRPRREELYKKFMQARARSGLARRLLLSTPINESAVHSHSQYKQCLLAHGFRL
jgi:hypothetical protein